MYTRPREITTIEATNKKTTEIQNQALDKGIQTKEILKVKIYQKQKSHASWLVMTINNIIKNN